MSTKENDIWNESVQETQLEKGIEQEFVDWFHNRGQFFANLIVRHFEDGEPYFYSE